MTNFILFHNHKKTKIKIQAKDIGQAWLRLVRLKDRYVFELKSSGYDLVEESKR